MVKYAANCLAVEVVEGEVRGDFTPVELRPYDSQSLLELVRLPARSAVMWAEFTERTLVDGRLD
jgi:hypothetical protein